VAESGEEELPPSLPHLHSPLHRPLPRIQAWRECPPLAPSPSPGRRSRHVSFASVPAAIRCGHGWSLASPHPQVR
jgi:hypothetical protein